MEYGEASMRMGNLHDALQWYLVVLSRPKDKKFLADAAYRAALIYGSDGPARDLDRAIAYLNYLRTAFPDSQRSTEALAALMWMRDLAAARSEGSAARADLDSLRSKMAEKQTALDRVQRDAAARADQARADATTDARTAAQVRTLRTEIDRLRADVARLEGELEKKNEALRRVASTVVGAKKPL